MSWHSNSQIYAISVHFPAFHGYLPIQAMHISACTTQIALQLVSCPYVLPPLPPPLQSPPNFHIVFLKLKKKDMSAPMKTVQRLSTLF